MAGENDIGIGSSNSKENPLLDSCSLYPPRVCILGNCTGNIIFHDTEIRIKDS